MKSYTLAGLAQAAATEIWHAYVPAAMPGLAGPAVGLLVGGCVFVIMQRLTDA